MNEHATRLRLLFVGNSHTFFNDMPEMVAERFRKDGYDCEVAMIAHGGLVAESACGRTGSTFNIRYGHYDYVMLQVCRIHLNREKIYKIDSHTGAVDQRDGGETDPVSAVDQMRW